MITKKTLGITGALAMAGGVFAPLVTVPIQGSVNYFQNGHGDGAFILVAAVLSLILVAANLYKGLWFTGLPALGLIAYDACTLMDRLEKAREEIAASLQGNPFASMAEALVQSVQVQWGWLPLGGGAILLLIAAVIPDQEPVKDLGNI